MVDENKDKAKTLLQQVSILFLKKTKKTSPISNISTIERKSILSTNIFGKKLGIKKLVLVLVILISVTVAREEVVENTESSKDDQNPKTIARASKDNKNLKTNLACVLYI